MLILIICIAALVTLLLVWSLCAQWRLRRRYPPSGEFVEVDGHRLHYLAAGQGPGLLLIHGANSNVLDFRDSLMPALARHYRVIAIDRPGFGHSPRGHWSHAPDAAQQIDLLLKACGKLGVEQPLVLGHSWAGAMVLTAAVRMPEHIRAGVVLAGVCGHWAGGPDWTQWPALVPGLRRVFAWLLLWPVGRGMLPAALRVVHQPQPVPAGYADAIGAWLALRPRTYLANAQDVTGLNGFMQSESRHFADIRTPLLLIHGEADAVVPIWNHAERLLPVVPEAELQRLPGVGHAPHHHDAADIAARIRHFDPALADPG